MHVDSELQKGVTYPQRGPMDAAEFRGYFLAYDVIVGVLIGQEEAEKLIGHALSQADDDDIALQVTKQSLIESRDWYTAYAFSYYIKVSSVPWCVAVRALTLLSVALSPTTLAVLPTCATQASSCHLPIAAWAWAAWQDERFCTTVPRRAIEAACSTWSMQTTKHRSRSGNVLASPGSDASPTPVFYARSMAEKTMWTPG